MIPRICAILIVTFWLVMTALLVRHEFFPDAAAGVPVPPRTVWERIFTAEDPSALKVYYDGEDAGVLNFRVEPLTGSKPGAVAAGSVTSLAGYRMDVELHMTLRVLDGAARVHMYYAGVFDPDYKLRSYTMKLRSTDKQTKADATAVIETDYASQRATIRVISGQHQESETVNLGEFDTDRIASLTGALGLSGPGKLWDAGTATAPRPVDTPGFPATTTTTRSSVVVAGHRKSAYLVTWRISNMLWVKIWVGMQGQILKVDTPFGLTMLAEGLSPEGTARVRAGSRL